MSKTTNLAVLFIHKILHFFDFQMILVYFKCFFHRYIFAPIISLIYSYNQYNLDFFETQEVASTNQVKFFASGDKKKTMELFMKIFMRKNI